VALNALAEGRAEALPDDEIVSRWPAVLALVPPRVGVRIELPPMAPAPPAGATGGSVEVDTLLLLREGLRLRARWVQELQGRAAGLPGPRLAPQGRLLAGGDIRCVRHADLALAIAGHDVAAIAGRSAEAAPLPAAFRLGPGGQVWPVELGDPEAGGRGAGGGRAIGPVHSGDGPPEAGAVLVVRTLDPALATVLPQLGGLVAETGSVLSHLAILAREFGVPTVVGVAGAVRRFPPGTTLLVDGATGTVTAVSSAPASAPSAAGVIDVTDRAAHAETAED
jgi:pyruvate,water dikinase